MPKVSLISPNQCTLDDPTDGAELPSAVVSNTAPNASSMSAAPVPACLAPEPDSEASTGGAEEIVRNFGRGDGAAPLVQPPVARERACGLEALAVASNCGKVVVEVAATLVKARLPELPVKNIDPFDALNCAISAAALVKCEFGD